MLNNPNLTKSSAHIAFQTSTHILAQIYVLMTWLCKPFEIWRPKYLKQIPEDFIINLQNTPNFISHTHCKQSLDWFLVFFDFVLILSCKK